MRTGSVRSAWALPVASPAVPLGNPSLRLGSRRYDLTRRCLVMGILNRTPDSFFDQGATFALDLTLRRAEALVAEGADILDVGGVKAGPGPAADQIVLDAGLDLGKTAAQSAVLLRESDRLAALGYPLLLSASNKTFLGVLLDLDIDARRGPTMVA